MDPLIEGVGMIDAYFFNWIKKSRDAGLYDVPWKERTPKCIITNVTLDDTPPQGDNEVIVYVEHGSIGIAMSDINKKLHIGTHDGIPINSLWNEWP